MKKDRKRDNDTCQSRQDKQVYQKVLCDKQSFKRAFKITHELTGSKLLLLEQANSILPSNMAATAAPAPTHKAKKPYEEISAFFNGNEVKIRVPKSTAKPPRLTPSQLKLQQSCTCDEDASICSETCGMICGENVCPSNRLDFQIPDDICESLTHRTALNSEMVYAMNPAHATMCNTCNVTPKDAPKGVQAQKVLHPDKDVFILKIGKQTDEPNRTGNIEVELVTPRAPAKAKPATHACMQIQCEEEDIPCCLPCRTCQIMPSKRRRGKRPRCCPY